MTEQATIQVTGLRSVAGRQIAHTQVTRILAISACFLVACALLCLHTTAQRDTSALKRPLVIEILLQDTIQPVSAAALRGNLQKANARQPAAILLNLSSPGGTERDAGDMVRAIRQSRAPVIVYLREPQGQVSGQALRIFLAGDLSAAHPEAHLQLWRGQMPSAKAAPEQIEALQQLNEDLKQALLLHGRSGAPIHLFETPDTPTGEDALRVGLVDALATSQEKLLTQLNGRTVRRVDGTEQVLQLQDAKLQELPMSAREHLMRALMNPDLAVLLLTLGALLVYLEINTPGSILPGAAGVTLVLLALYALLLMPLRWQGVVLILLSAVLLLAEARLRHGAMLAVMAITALIFGLRLLVLGPIPELEVDWSTAIGTGLGFGGITAGLLLLGAKARRAKVRVGGDAMLGWLAVVQTSLAPEGEVLVRGELWRARLSGDGSLNAGECVKVLAVNGSVLEVSPLPVVNRL